MLVASQVGMARAETLSQALAMAYASNPQLLEQRAYLRSVDQGVSKALSGWRPTVTLSADGSSVKRDAYKIKGVDQRSVWRQDRSLGVTLSQPVFTGFGTVNAVDQSKHQVLAERETLRSVEQTVLLSAVTAYLDVWRDMAVVDLRTNNEQVLQRQLEASRDRFDVGEITRTDVAQSEARLSKARADRVSAEGDLQVSRAVYKRVMGKSPEDISVVPPADGLPPELTVLLTEALGGNPDYKAADYTVQVKDDAVGVVRAELLPDVKLVASATQLNDQSYSDDEMKVYSVGATLTMPLYEAGSVYARLRAAKDQVAQSRKALERVQRTVVETGTSSWESLVSARAQIVAYREEVRASGIALDGVRREAEVGSRTVLDVLDAEQELLDARVNLVKAQRNEALASYQVLSAMGRLTAADMGLDVPLYDPKVHYRDSSGAWFGTSVFSDDGREGIQAAK
ncbi:MAG: TolC family outer membrane protein [Rhodospirillaceae bacterium]|nr:TolC family outer membrane protein [Rhodospirillaceae bacterium]